MRGSYRTHRGPSMKLYRLFVFSLLALGAPACGMGPPAGHAGTTEDPFPGTASTARSSRVHSSSNVLASLRGIPGISLLR